MNQLIFDFAHQDYPSLDKFLGTANAELRYVLQHKNNQFIYVWGQNGSGKSHLLQAWIAQAIQAGNHALYIDATNIPLTDSALDYNYLAIDQVDLLQEHEQALLFEIFNRYRNNKQGHLLLSANTPPNQLTIREDLRTRMGYCLVYDIKPLSDNEKIQALISIAQARQLDVEPDIFQHLLHHWRRDMDSLMQMLETLCHYSAITQKRITLPLLRQLLKQQKE